jgi:hypothetical protein
MKTNFRFCHIALLVATLLVGNASANIELTEVDLANGVIELTNTSGTVSSGVILEWCVPFSYGVLETAGYSFLPGETRTYNLGFNFGSADDLWIYKDRTGNFGQTDRVISGVVYGSNQAGAGRVDSVVSNTGGDAWAANTDFVATAGIMSGQTLQMSAPALAPNASSGWEIASSSLGSFGATTDVDGDGDADCDDITALTEEIFAGTNSAFADLTGDGIVDMGDQETWLRESGGFLPGDSNFDGAVDGQDFLTWNANKFQAISGYCNGDFNGDGNVNGSDFLIWNANKFQPITPTTVPEPQPFLFVYLVIMSMIALLRNKKK